MQSSGGSTTAVRSDEEEYLDCYIQEELKRSLQKGEIESHWISFRNPVNHQIGQELHEVYHREKPR